MEDMNYDDTSQKYIYAHSRLINELSKEYDQPAYEKQKNKHALVSYLFRQLQANIHEQYKINEIRKHNEKYQYSFGRLSWYFWAITAMCYFAAVINNFAWNHDWTPYIVMTVIIVFFIDQARHTSISNHNKVILRTFGIEMRHIHFELGKLGLQHIQEIEELAIYHLYLKDPPLYWSFFKGMMYPTSDEPGDNDALYFGFYPDKYFASEGDESNKVNKKLSLAQKLYPEQADKIIRMKLWMLLYDAIDAENYRKATRVLEAENSYVPGANWDYGLFQNFQRNKKQREFEKESQDG